MRHPSPASCGYRVVRRQAEGGGLAFVIRGDANTRVERLSVADPPIGLLALPALTSLLLGVVAPRRVRAL